MAEPEVQLGDIARDSVTGYEGTVVARTEWLNGCWRVLLQAKSLDKNGKPHDGYSVDVEQLEIVKRGKHVPNKLTGGPRDDPRRTGL